MNAAGASISRSDKARTLGEQNNDPNAAVYKTNYDRAHAKLKETTKKQ